MQGKRKRRITSVCGEDVGENMRAIPFILCVFFAIVLIVLILGIRYGNFP